MGLDAVFSENGRASCQSESMKLFVTTTTSFAYNWSGVVSLKEVFRFCSRLPIEVSITLKMVARFCALLRSRVDDVVNPKELSAEANAADAWALVI